MKEDAAAFDKFAAAHPDHPLTQQVLAEFAKLQGDLRLSANKRFERMVILSANAHRLAIDAEANIPLGRIRDFPDVERTVTSISLCTIKELGGPPLFPVTPNHANSKSPEAS